MKLGGSGGADLILLQPLALLEKRDVLRKLDERAIEPKKMKKAKETFQDKWPSLKFSE